MKIKNFLFLFGDQVKFKNVDFYLSSLGNKILRERNIDERSLLRLKINTIIRSYRYSSIKVVFPLHHNKCYCAIFTNNLSFFSNSIILSSF